MAGGGRSPALVRRWSMKGSDGPRGCSKSSTSAAMVTLGKRARESECRDDSGGGLLHPGDPVNSYPSCHFLARFTLFPIISFRCIITMNCALIALAITK